MSRKKHLIDFLQIFNCWDWCSFSEGLGTAIMVREAGDLFPGTGWIDIDVQLDDRENGEHGFQYLGYRSSSRVITFTGDYAELDNKTVFTRRSWYASYWWYSIDRKNRADVQAPVWSSYAQKLDDWGDNK